jgi:serine protease Do
MNRIKTIPVILPYQKSIIVIIGAVIFLAVSILSMSAHADENGLESLRKTGKAFAKVAKEVSPAVVFIKVEKKLRGVQDMDFIPPGDEAPEPFGDDFFRRFFNKPFPEERHRNYRSITGQGSGFIISNDGYILTNNHVAGGADEVIVTLYDGREFEAKVIGSDPQSDVAVIKIDIKNLPTIPLGDSDTLEVGEWVLAVGNPFGLSHTLTSGIVSAKGRSSIGITDYEDFIQTDAAINPGNSGGPLINLDGEVVGINTAIFSQSGGYMGIGFAIPINMVKDIRDQLIENGSVVRGYLGIYIQDLTSELVRSFELKDNKGVLISQVTKGSPADKAGLRQGDIIIEFDDKPVEKVGSFRNSVAFKVPGLNEKLIILRDGKPKTISIEIGKLPSNDKSASVRQEDSFYNFGLTVKNLTHDLAERLELEGETGVVVTEVEPGSIAASAGIRPGMVITEVNQKEIHDVEEFKKAMEKGDGKDTVLLLIKSREFSRYAALRLKK